MANRINQTIAQEYKNRFGTAPDMVAVDIHGLSVAEFEEFRDQARGKGMEVFVVKTSLARLVLRDVVQSEAVDEVVLGPTAFVWGGEGMPDVVKLVDQLGRKTHKLAVRGGFLGKAVVPPADVMKFRSIPDRKTLLAQVLATILTPLTGTLGVVNSLLWSPAGLADSLAKKRGSDSPAS